LSHIVPASVPNYALVDNNDYQHYCAPPNVKPTALEGTRATLKEPTIFPLRSKVFLVVAEDVVVACLLSGSSGG
jgi:hypothetical protein